MKIIHPKIIIEKSELDPNKIFTLEKAARTCYKSEKNTSETIHAAGSFIESIVRRGHESVLEHEKVTVRIITDRGQSHAIVRHRIASFSQESTIYCNYTNEKFGDDLLFIQPIFPKVQQPSFNPDEHTKDDIYENYDVNAIIWEEHCMVSENAYKQLIKNGCTPQQARSVLPTSIKTELVMTANMREWRHFFNCRIGPTDHTSMHQLSIPLLRLFHKTWYGVFNDIHNKLDYYIEKNQYRLTKKDYAEIEII